MFWTFLFQTINSPKSVFPACLPSNQPTLQSLPSIACQSFDPSTHKRIKLINLKREDLMEAGYETIKKQWTEEEDTKLRHLREKQHLDWVSISQQMENRNPKMCYSRYRRLENHAKQSWTRAEDQKLMVLVAEYGEDWRFISQHFQKRTHKQIKEHYVNYLRPEIKREQWTIEEDLQLIDCLNAFGKDWSQIEKNLDGRTQNQIKNRYFGRLKKLSEKKSMLKGDRSQNQ